MPIIWTYDGLENKYDIYGGKDCMEMFCEFIRRHAIKIINLEKENYPINKRIAEIIWKDKNLLPLQKKSLHDINEKTTIY